LCRQRISFAFEENLTSYLTLTFVPHFGSFLVFRFDKKYVEVRPDQCADRNTVGHPAEKEQT